MHKFLGRVKFINPLGQKSAFGRFLSCVGINSNKWLWNWLNSWYRSKNLKKLLLNNVHWKICYLIMYILSARFQLENWSAPARLGSAWNLYSSARLELGNSSSGSSLIFAHNQAYLIWNEMLCCLLFVKKNLRIFVNTFVLCIKNGRQNCDFEDSEQMVVK